MVVGYRYERAPRNETTRKHIKMVVKCDGIGRSYRLLQTESLQLMIVWKMGRQG